MPSICVLLIQAGVWYWVGEPLALTLPPPDGVAHVPSPRQYVLDVAPVPPFR
jgi:hypothetical protein